MKNRQFRLLFAIIVIWFWIVIYQIKEIRELSEFYHNDSLFRYDSINDKVILLDEKVNKIKGAI